MTIDWQVEIRLVCVAPVAALQAEGEIMSQSVAGSPTVVQQAAALVQTEQLALPEPPAAPLVPLVPPVAPLVPPVAPLVPPAAPPVPVPLVPPVPPVHLGTPAMQVSNCVQSEILRQSEVADSIVEAFVQVAPLWPPLPEDVVAEQSVVAVAVLASA